MRWPGLFAFVVLAPCVACAAQTAPAPAPAPAPGTTPAPGATGPGQPVKLDNGIVVKLIAVPGSADINIITTVPLSLANDDAGKTQWSHLIEHLVSSSAGPAPYDEINAETLSDCMHLDYSRPAATWKDGVAQHAKWLSIRTFEAAAIEREIGRVIEEVASLSSSGRTPKFAVAAWAQATRFGSANVEVNGDVKRARADELAAYCQAHFLAGPPPVIAVAGQFDRDAMLAELNASIGTIKLPPPLPAPQWVADEKIPARITWDLAPVHVVISWRVPDGLSPVETAYVLSGSLALMQQWQRLAPGYLAPNTLAMVEGNVRVADRRYVIATLTLPKPPTDETLAAIRADVDRLTQTITGEPGMPRTMGRMGMNMQFSLFDDLQNTLKQAADNGINRRMVEGNIAVMTCIAEFRAGRHMAELRDALKAKSQDDAAARKTLQRVFDPKGRRELVIVPTQ